MSAKRKMKETQLGYLESGDYTILNIIFKWGHDECMILQ